MSRKQKLEHVSSIPKDDARKATRAGWSMES